jgi:hypothetical protein
MDPCHCACVPTSQEHFGLSADPSLVGQKRLGGCGTSGKSLVVDHHVEDKLHVAA